MENKHRIEKWYREMEVAFEQLGEGIENEDEDEIAEWSQNVRVAAQRISLILEETDF